jgi:hypothetical protein
MANTLTLTNPTINGGTAMRLLTANFTYQWNSITSDYPQPGRFTIAPVMMQGWSNPAMSVRFIIEMSNPTSGCITFSQLFALARYNGTSNTTLNINVGNSDTALGSYASSASAVTSIPVIIKSISFNVDPGYNVNSDKIVVDMQLLETVTS